MSRSPRQRTKAEAWSSGVGFAPKWTGRPLLVPEGSGGSVPWPPWSDTAHHLSGLVLEAAVQWDVERDELNRITGEWTLFCAFICNVLYSTMIIIYMTPLLEHLLCPAHCCPCYGLQGEEGGEGAVCSGWWLWCCSASSPTLRLMAASV